MANDSKYSNYVTNSSTQIGKKKIKPYTASIVVVIAVANDFQIVIIIIIYYTKNRLLLPPKSADNITQNYRQQLQY